MARDRRREHPDSHRTAPGTVRSTGACGPRSANTRSGMIEPLGVHLAEASECEVRQRHLIGGFAGENRAGLGRGELLQPERPHHRLADHREAGTLARVADAVDDDGAGGQGPLHAQAESRNVPDAAVGGNLAGEGVEGERRAACADGLPPVRGPFPEREDRIALVFLNRPAAADHFPGEPLEHAADRLLQFERRRLPHHHGVVADVADEHRGNREAGRHHGAAPDGRIRFHRRAAAHEHEGEAGGHLDRLPRRDVGFHVRHETPAVHARAVAAEVTHRAPAALVLGQDAVAEGDRGVLDEHHAGRFGAAGLEAADFERLVEHKPLFPRAAGLHDELLGRAGPAKGSHVPELGLGCHRSRALRKSAARTGPA